MSDLGAVRQELEAAGFLAASGARTWWIYQPDSLGYGVYVSVESLRKQYAAGTLAEYVGDFWSGVHQK